MAAVMGLAMTGCTCLDCDVNDAVCTAVSNVIAGTIEDVFALLITPILGAPA